jgi:hypothetical protein
LTFQVATQGKGGKGQKGPNMAFKSDDPRDRRNDVRIDVSFPIIIDVEQSGERTPAIVENVSLCGVLLRTEVELPMRSRVNLEITLGESPMLRIPALVVRATGAQSYGTSFGELSASDADRLMDLAADCLRSAAPAPWFLG